MVSGFMKMESSSKEDGRMGDSRFTGQEEDEFDRTVSAFSAPRHRGVSEEGPEREEDAPKERKFREPKAPEERRFQEMDVPGERVSPEPEEEDDEFDRTVSAFSARQGRTRTTGQEAGKNGREAQGGDNSVKKPSPAKGIGAKKPLSLGLVITLSVLAGILLAAL